MSSAASDRDHTRPRLTDRIPRLRPDELVARLEPHARFGDVRFATYLPDPEHPSQQAAVEVVEDFARVLGSGSSAARRRSRLRRGGRSDSGPAGLYLDGGFGVGKTHLLASLWHVAPQPSAFLSFVELTALIGSFGMDTAVEAFAGHKLLCIDEFELDDVAHTLMTVTFLRRLIPGGTRVVCTSNTLPDRLGEGRFGADDFTREIEAIASHFEIVTIDGPDYRHRSFAPVAPLPEPEFDRRTGEMGEGTTVDGFAEVLAHLRKVHPVQYGAMLDGVGTVAIRGLTTIEHQDDALLWVQFVDELYEAEVGLVACGTAVEDLFSPSYRHGGYRKKYGRAESRLCSMLAEAHA